MYIHQQTWDPCSITWLSMISDVDCEEYGTQAETYKVCFHLLFDLLF